MRHWATRFPSDGIQTSAGPDPTDCQATETPSEVVAYRIIGTDPGSGIPASSPTWRTAFRPKAQWRDLDRGSSAAVPRSRFAPSAFSLRRRP
jgi:hypothetical protein